MTTTAAAPTTAPSAEAAGGAEMAVRAFRYWLLRYRNTWQGSIVISIAARYAAFVAPALLATSAMNSAVNEMAFNVWWRVRFDKLYDAIVTTPMRIGEIAASVPMRGLTTGQFGVGMLAATAYLLAMGAGGAWIAYRRLGQMLLT